MARPKTKSELLEQSQKNYGKLLAWIDNLPEEQLEISFPEGYLNRNIKDVLAHLHEWNLMMLDWYNVGMAGDKPDMPAKGYTWKTLPDLNRKIQAKHATLELAEARRLLNESFKKTLKITEQHTDQELFEKKRYKWTGSTSLGAYLVSATSSHYDWAFKLIKKCIKQLSQ